jgi:glutathione peroxidase
MSMVHDFTATTLEGREKPLSDFTRQVLLVVNTASKCGFAPRYEGLEALYRKFYAERFAILGFPCNQFGAQEPGDTAEIARFCPRTFMTFPMFGKIDVNGAEAHPLYRFLKGASQGSYGNRGDHMEFCEISCRSKRRRSGSLRTCGSTQGT